MFAGTDPRLGFAGCKPPVYSPNNKVVNLQGIPAAPKTEAEKKQAVS
jgi:hypothetical protein